MKFGPIPVSEAQGKILAHHITAKDGAHSLRKGKPLLARDIAALRELGQKVVMVAELEPGDLGEDSAAERVARAVCGRHLSLTRPNVGRVNLKADCLGVLHVDVDSLARLNEIEGITLATLRSNSVAKPRETVATVKVIPFALPEDSVCAAESLGDRM